MNEDLRRANPVNDTEGTRWAASASGARTRERMLSRLDTETAAPGSRRLLWGVATVLTALVLVFATVIVVRDEPVPVAGGCRPTAHTAEGFTPPEGYPQETPDPRFLWHGSDELWTIIDTDGGYSDRKSVWWSVHFPGGSEEEQPPLTVSALQLDGDGEIGPEHPATNAYTPVDGWLMIADFPFEFPPGCWEITAEYKGATTSFVVEVAEPFQCEPTVVGDPSFQPPEPYPATPPDLYQAHWYGTSDLWTMIPFDGASIWHEGDKLFFWSEHFSYGSDDWLYGPDLTVTFTRLDVDAEPIVITDATNGTRSDIGTFMLTGFHPPAADGCYEVLADYRGAELRYIAQVAAG